MSREKACSGIKEWVKPHKLFADRTCPWSLCLREGGSIRWREEEREGASLRQRGGVGDKAPTTTHRKKN